MKRFHVSPLRSEAYLENRGGQRDGAVRIPNSARIRQSRPKSRQSRPKSRQSRPESRHSRPESRQFTPESRQPRPESRHPRPDFGLDCQVKALETFPCAPSSLGSGPGEARRGGPDTHPPLINQHYNTISQHYNIKSQHCNTWRSEASSGTARSGYTSTAVLTHLPCTLHVSAVGPYGRRGARSLR